MHSVEYNIELQYMQQQKIERYKKHNAARRKIRLVEKKCCYSHLLNTTHDKLHAFQSNMMSTIEPDCINLYDNYQIAERRFEELLADNNHEISDKLNNIYDEAISLETMQSNDEDDDCIPHINVPLHHYTLKSTYEYCKAFTIIARQANLSKKSTYEFLSLIRSGLSCPNNMPSSVEELLLLLDVEELFTKRSICLLCYNEFACNDKFCPRCCATDRYSIAYM